MVIPTPDVANGYFDPDHDVLLEDCAGADAGTVSRTELVGEPHRCRSLSGPNWLPVKNAIFVTTPIPNHRQTRAIHWVVAGTQEQRKE